MCLGVAMDQNKSTTSSPTQSVVLNWNNVVQTFLTGFNEIFQNDRKAHFDNLPEELCVVDGAKVHWCNLLLLDAMISILTMNNGLKKTTRRAFKQQQVLQNAIIQELKHANSTVFDSLQLMFTTKHEVQQDWTTYQENITAFTNHIRVSVTDIIWQSFSNFETNTSAHCPASKAKNKYPLIVKFLTRHESFANNSLTTIIQDVVRKAVTMQNSTASPVNIVSTSSVPLGAKTKKIKLSIIDSLKELHDDRAILVQQQPGVLKVENLSSGSLHAPLIASSSSSMSNGGVHHGGGGFSNHKSSSSSDGSHPQASNSNSSASSSSSALYSSTAVPIFRQQPQILRQKQLSQTSVLSPRLSKNSKSNSHNSSTETVNNSTNKQAAYDQDNDSDTRAGSPLLDEGTIEAILRDFDCNFETVPADYVHFPMFIQPATSVAPADGTIPSQTVVPPASHGGTSDSQVRGQKPLTTATSSNSSSNGGANYSHYNMPACLPADDDAMQLQHDQPSSSKNSAHSSSSSSSSSSNVISSNHHPDDAMNVDDNNDNDTVCYDDIMTPCDDQEKEADDPNEYMDENDSNEGSHSSSQNNSSSSSDPDGDGAVTKDDKKPRKVTVSSLFNELFPVVFNMKLPRNQKEESRAGTN